MRFFLSYWAAIGCLTYALLPTSANADIYRCTDRDGTVHFTNVRERGRRCRVAVRERKRRTRRSSATRPKLSSSAARHAAQRSSKTASDPNRRHRYDAIISAAAHLYRLPPSFIRAVMQVESNFNPHVVSHAGAIGLMQLMPRTASSMGVRDPFDPRQNILGGARYLRILANRFRGNLVLTVAAYNAGEGAVLRYRGVPPYAETRRYVRRVLEHYYRFRSRS